MGIIESGWLKILNDSGSGNANIGVQTKELNKGRSSRSKGIIVKTSKGTTKGATITQNGNPAYITVVSTKNMGANEQEVVIEGVTNIASLNFALSNNNAGLSLPQTITINRTGANSFDAQSNDVESRAISQGTAIPAEDYGSSHEMAFRIVLQGSINNTVNQRSSTLTISGSGVSAIVTIIQAEGDSTLSVEDVTLGYEEGSTGTLVIESNDSFSISIDE